MFTLEYRFIWIQSYRAEIWAQQGVGAALGILSVDVREVIGRVGGGKVERARLPQQIFPAISGLRGVEQERRAVGGNARNMILSKNKQIVV